MFKLWNTAKDQINHIIFESIMTPPSHDWLGVRGGGESNPVGGRWSGLLGRERGPTEVLHDNDHKIPKGRLFYRAA